MLVVGSILFSILSLGRHTSILLVGSASVKTVYTTKDIWVYHMIRQYSSAPMGIFVNQTENTLVNNIGEGIGQYCGGISQETYLDFLEKTTTLVKVFHEEIQIPGMCCRI